MIGQKIYKLNMGIGLFIGLAIAMVGVCLSASTAEAQTVTPGICRTAIVLDVSSSVDNQELNIMRNQVRRLFQPGGLYDDKIQLAFWTFSHQDDTDNNGTPNYNAPFYSYVSSRGENSNFTRALNSPRFAGTTNYQQGFAYNGGTRNPYLNSIINSTDIIAFLTDGIPNRPALIGWLTLFNPTPQSALDAGRSAVLKHRAAGRDIVGGLIGDFSAEPLNYVMNGSKTNGTDVFRISGGFDDLAVKLRGQIGPKCAMLNPPQPSVTYSLRPAVSASPTIGEQGEKVSFSYAINNSQPATNPSASYSTIGLKVNPGVSTGPVTGYTNGYKDDGTSVSAIGNALINQLGGSSKASLVASAPSGTWSKASSIPNEDFIIPLSAQAGEKYCRVLVITKPTEAATPQYRYSSAVCFTVGKKPKVQIHGGDLQVGRTFIDSATVSSLQSIVRSSTTTLGTKTFGSWIEYGVMAPGVITGTASAAGLQGGNTSNQQQNWSKLSFANEPAIGNFTDPASKWIPDVAGALRRLYDEVTAPRVSGTVALDASRKGLYVASGDIKLSSYQFRTPGQTVILYAPSNTVTIAGDITYGAQRMSSSKDIPQLVVIANRINIESGVGQVDGWLVANGEQGRIDTCSDVSALTTLLCSKQLTVNGPVMAKQLFLKRTAGAQGNDDSARDTAAEKFNLRADAYLWAYSISSNERRVITTYTTELSPRF